MPFRAYLQVVALFLSMSVEVQAKPMGYDYPTPSIPFIEGIVSTTSKPASSPLPAEYDDYDPSDIPADQAAPSNNKGYEYPVPENPLVLPTKPPKTTTTTTELPLPDCIPVEERDLGMNIDLLEAGVPLCPDYDEYNPNDIPSDQAPTPPDCVPVEEQNEGYNPTFIEQGVPLCPAEELPGYEYPVPENPLTLPTEPTTTTTESVIVEVFDDYNPDDVPADQAPPSPECVLSSEKDEGYNPTFLDQGVPLCPEEAGYEYPVPENPLVLPTKPVITTTSLPLPECIPVEERDLGMNIDLLEAGVPLCPDFDEYNPNDIPSDQAPTPPDCIPLEEENEGYNPTFLEQGVPFCPEEELPGYEYPVPENPLTLPTQPATTAVLPEPTSSLSPVLEVSFDDYNPDDVPTDQAPPSPECVLSSEKDIGYNPTFLEQGVPLCPEEEAGYEYPVPENPLVLPTKPTTTSAPLPDCIPVEERDLGMNIDLLEAGVPLCPDYDEYNPNDIPSDQAPTPPDCIPVEEQNEGYNPNFLDQGVPLCPEEELPGYEYPVPENPLTLPTKPLTTTTTTEAPILPSQSPVLEVFDDYNPDDVPIDQAPPAPECVPSTEKDYGYNPTFLEQGVPLCPEEKPGYEYPIPENPLTLPAKSTTAAPEPTPTCIPEEERDVGLNPEFLAQGVPICPSSDLPGYEPITEPPTESSYDDYDIYDIPPDQAAPAPECVPSSEQNIGPNPSFISQGVPICPEEEKGYNYPVPSNPLELPQKKARKSKTLPDNMKPVMGISITNNAGVFSFHMPTGHGFVTEGNAVKMTDKTINSGEPHDSGTHPLNDELKNKSFVAGKQKLKQVNKIAKASKSGATKKKQRNGKALFEDESNEESSQESKGIDKTSSGIRTISVREWLRRG